MTKTSFIIDIQMLKYIIFLDAFALLPASWFQYLLTGKCIFEVQHFAGS